MRQPLLAVVAILIAVHQSHAGQDFVSNWGNNDPLIDQYGKHALCLESKSYFVNSSDERSQACPRNTCRFEIWRDAQYTDEKYTNNSKYALRRIPQRHAKNYLYLPNTNVEFVHKPVMKKANEVYPRKVVAFGQMVAEQHNAVFYAHFLDPHYRTDKDSGDRASAEPHTSELEGIAAIRKYIDPMFLWELLPDTHPDKQTCAAGNVTFTKRVYDIKHPDRTKERYNTDILDFIHPDQQKHNCLVILGFYKNIYPCEESISSMWGSIEREMELSKSVAAAASSSSDRSRESKRAQKTRHIYASYKHLATHQGDFVSKHRPSPIKFKRTKPKPAVGVPLPKKMNAFNTPPKVGHILGDTSYERDNNPDLLMKRLRYKNLQKKQGKKGGLFLDGMEIS